MVRYAREGHGFRGSKHLVDVIDRSVAWYQGPVDGTATEAPADGRIRN